MANKNTRHITKVVQNKFIARLKGASDTPGVETEVIAPAYRDVIEAFFEGSWRFDHGTDGFFADSGQVFASVRLLLEAKYDLDLRSVHGRAVIVAQCIYYMKAFERHGHDQPNVIFGADKDQMFVVYAPPLRKYLEHDFDWSLAPSSAAAKNPELMAMLEEDRLLATFVHNIHETGFDLNDVMMTIDRLSENDGAYDRIAITPQNIRAAFDSFLLMLNIGKARMANEDAVTLFITSLLGGAEAAMVDPAVKNTIHLHSGKTLRVDTVAYEAFFSRYESVYQQTQVDALVAMYDVLLEEVSRRFSGDYWTPTIWADEAHRLLDETLGEDWREQFVVWDPACGTKNLTRDYITFTDLYLSTLHQHELDTSGRYNREAKATFQYDFLNDDIGIGPNALFGDDWKMPAALYRALNSDRPVLFFMNPPYGTATNDDETHKAGIAFNGVGAAMRAEGGLAAASGQLYTQFLYRIQQLTHDFGLTRVVIAAFTPDRFMTGVQYKAFTDRFQKDFGYRDGFYFNAGEFSDVQSNWGIGFTVWDTAAVGQHQNAFPLALARATDRGVRMSGRRTVRNIGPRDVVSTWLKAGEPSRYTLRPDSSYVRLKSALGVHTAKTIAGHLAEDSLGYMHNNGSSVEHSSKFVGMYSTAFGSGHGVQVNARNFERACMVLTARKTTIPAAEDMWITGHDNVTPPSSEPPAQFVADSVVYALCSRNGSYQSAMRGVEYQGRTMNLFNEFFFLPAAHIKALAENAGNRDVLVDVKNFGRKERFAAQWLEDHRDDLSMRGRALLEIVTRMVGETFPLRGAASDDLHMHAWDAGFAQIYRLAKANRLDVAEQYRGVHEHLDHALCSQVKNLGFLAGSTQL